MAYLENPDRRAGGIELEWAVVNITNPATSCNQLWTEPAVYEQPTDDLECYFRPNASTRIRFENATLLYKDCGDNGETATGVCIGLRQMALYGSNLKHIVASILEKHSNRRPLRTQCRVAGYNGGSKGYHSSYSTYKPDGMDRLHFAREISGLLVGMTAFNGAGIVVEDEAGRPRIAPAQKARHITNIHENSTTNKDKPWIVNRESDDHNGNNRNYFRFQIVGQDANMSAFQTYITVGMNSIVLRLISNGIDLGHLRPADIAKATNAAANDYSRSALIEVGTPGNKQELRTVDLIEAYLEIARNNIGDGIFADDEIPFIDTAQGLVDEYRNDFYSLHNAFDHVYKARQLEEKGITSVRKARFMDLLYDAIGHVKIEHKNSRDEKPKTFMHGTGMRLEELDFYRGDFTPEEREYAYHHPPAHSREEHMIKTLKILKAAGMMHRVSGLEWDRLSFKVADDNIIHLYLHDTHGRLSIENHKAMKAIIRIAESKIAA